MQPILRRCERAPVVFEDLCRYVEFVRQTHRNPVRPLHRVNLGFLFLFDMSFLSLVRRLGLETRVRIRIGGEVVLLMIRDQIVDQIIGDLRLALAGFVGAGGLAGD